jgi:hypothetical protein
VHSRVITIRTPLFLAMKDVAPLVRCERTSSHHTFLSFLSLLIPRITPPEGMG